MKHLKVSLRLALGFAVVLVLTGAVAFVGYNGLNTVIRHIEVVNDQNHLIQLALEARRQEKNFVLRGGQEYVDQVDAAVDAITTHMIETAGTLEEDAGLPGIIASYSQAFDNHVALEKQKADANAIMVEAARTAIEVTAKIRDDQEDKLFAEIAKGAGTADTDMKAVTDRFQKAKDAISLVLGTLEVHRNEKNYMLRHEQQYADEVAAQTADMLTLLEDLKVRFKDPANDAQADQVITTLQAYQEAFDEYVDAVNQQAEQDTTMVATAQQFIAGSEALRATATEEMLTAESSAQTMTVGAAGLAFLFGFVAAVVITQSITRPILSLRDVAIALAEGDLTREIQLDDKSRDEVGELGAALGKMIATWRGIIGGLRDDAVRLSTTAAELASSAEELTRTTAAQSDEINRTSTGVEEMATTIREVARNAELAAQAATDSSRRAQAGGELVTDTATGLGQANEIMQRLRSRSDEIDTIVNLIQDVAAQTNILALNAAIEAAGAGAAGARFDVVAEEIRQLARRTSQATGEIAALIGAVQSDTEAAAEAIARGAVIAKESGASLTGIVETSAVVNDMVLGISTSTEQQSRTSEEIARSLDAVAGGSQHTVAATRETAQIGVELSNLAERLKEAASQFKI